MSVFFFLKKCRSNVWIFKLLQTKLRYKKQLKKFPVFEPKFLLLSAYLSAICGDMKKTQHHLNRALRLCTQHKNLLEVDWIEHHLTIWQRTCADRSLNTGWIARWATGHPCSDLYTLPLPRKWYSKDIGFIWKNWQKYKREWIKRMGINGQG